MMAFSALTLLVACQEEHPACKKWVTCLQQGANDLHLVQLKPLPPHYLVLHYNPEWLIYLFVPVTKVVPIKGPV